MFDRIDQWQEADLPVRARPGTELFINLKTAAKALDLTVPNALSVSAN